MSITRRLFLRHTAATGAVAVTVAAPAASAPQSPQEAWAVIMASLRREVGSDCRIQLTGNDNSLFVVVWRTVMEQVSPRQVIPVDRIVASYALEGGGWKPKGVHR